MTSSKKGIFLLRQDDQARNDTPSYERITHSFVRFEKLIYIRSSKEKANSVEYYFEPLFKMNEIQRAEKVINRGHIKNIIHELPDYFLQIHQGIIINMEYITGRTGKKSTRIIEVAGQSLPVGKNFRESVGQALQLFGLSY